jgi:hypothetical protein
LKGKRDDHDRVQVMVSIKKYLLKELPSLLKMRSCLARYTAVNFVHGFISSSGEGACRQLKQCLKNHTSEGVEDHRLIRCDKFGLFEPLQKQEDGSMICALPEGEFPEPYGVTAGKRECIGKH